MELTPALGQGGNEADLKRAFRGRSSSEEVTEWANEEGFTLLHEACWTKPSYASAELLLKAGADPNSIDKDKDTPLHFCARLGTAEHHEIAELLIGHGANSSRLLMNKYGATPLHVALWKGHMEMARLLEKDVASPPPAQELNGQVQRPPTPLHARCCTTRLSLV